MTTSAMHVGIANVVDRILDMRSQMQENNRQIAEARRIIEQAHKQRVRLREQIQQEKLLLELALETQEDPTSLRIRLSADEIRAQVKLLRQDADRLDAQGFGWVLGDTHDNQF